MPSLCCCMSFSLVACTGFSLLWLVMFQSLLASVVVAPEIWSTDSIVVSYGHVGSSRIRDQPMCPALAGEILYHRATREAPGLSFDICKVGVLMSTHSATGWIKRALSGT